MSEAHVIRAGDGELRIVPAGGRIQSCTLPGADGNVFYQTRDGGGDRLWIAPEAAYFWPTLELAREDPVKHAITPAAVDPGDYRFTSRGDDHAVLVCEGVELTDSRVSKAIRFDVERSVRAIAPPPPEVGLPRGLSVASFAITNTLTLRGGDDGALAGAWDILQVPRGGVLVCPLVRPLCEPPTSYYDPFGKSVSFAADAVRFHADGKRRMKMGLPPEVTTGRMGYLRGGTLIVRIFAPLVGEPYVDVPLTSDKAARRGSDCLQAYSDDGTFGAFGEMEHHDPALIVGAQPMVRSGTSVTHVIAGEVEAVRTAGALLLGADLSPCHHDAT